MSGLTLFTQIPVVPVTRVHQHVALGGPIWPTFTEQTWVRHCRDRKPWDNKPDLPERLRPMAGPAVWGGFLDSHFGHFVADHLPRLAFALQERPGDVYLFTVDPGMTRDRLGPWVWQVFDWIGLPQDKVHLVTEGLYVAQLRVAPQAEMLSQVPPAQGYLDIVATWARDTIPVATPTLYVSRQDVPQLGGGGHAGETYLVGLLKRLGVVVLDPAKAEIAQQMASYAGAERLIFAEGSALHGRQLLAWLPQQINVLRRRPDKVMAQAALTPRCARLTYHDVIAGRLMAYWKSGKARPDPALGLYDVAALFQVFRGFDIDLAAHWNPVAFAGAAREDIAAWIARQAPSPKQLDEYRAVLHSLGLAVD